METMTKIEPEPRWPTAIAMIAIGGLFYALPSAMTVGPDWLVLVLVAVADRARDVLSSNADAPARIRSSDTWRKAW